MNFMRLSALATRISGRILGVAEDGALRYAWLPSGPAVQAQTAAHHSLAVGVTLRGPARLSPGVAMGLAVQTDDLYSFAVDGIALPWDPVPGITTLLYGTARDTAARYTVTAVRRSSGTVEIEARRVQSLT